jgi:N-acetylmuramoyl-L-alanine amidase
MQPDVAAPAPAPATAAPALAPGATPRPTSAPVLTRVPRPTVSGPRRVGIQAGHWLTGQAPPELRGLLTQTGTAWNGINEVTINVDIAERIKRMLEPKGIVVDILPTTIPPSYVADAFVALHGDGDGTGVRSGYKLAYSARRTPYEAALLESIKTHYGAATGLAYDQAHVSRNMLGYYAMAWTRNKYSTAPHTPSVILEMGYVSHDHDRYLMMSTPDIVAGGIAEGIIRFLDAHPRDRLFGQDLLIQLPAPRGAPTPRL